VNTARPARTLGMLAVVAGLSSAVAVAADARAQLPVASSAPTQGLAPHGSLPALEDVQLDSGLTLADWVRVVENKEPQPSLATASQAASYVRRYGAYFELVEIVWRATRRPEFSPHLGPEPDPAKLAALADARRRLGDWPDLLYASARVKAQLGDSAGATADLRRWMALSPTDAPRRTDIAEKLLLADNDVAAAMAALTQELRAQVTAPRRPVPPELAPYTKEMAKALECVGAPATADAVVRQMYASSGSDKATTVVTEWRALENGLSTLDMTHSASPRPAPGDVSKDKNAHSALGPRWEHFFGRTQFSVTDNRWAVPALQCSGALLPARIGNKISTSYTNALWQQIQFLGRKPSTERGRFVQEVSATYEIVAGPLTLDEARRYIPELEIEPNVPPEWRLFAISGSGAAAQGWTEGSSAGPKSRQDFSQTSIFVEGPNVMIAPFDDKYQKAPRRVVLETLKSP
jgi:hypothetical protein